MYTRLVRFSLGPGKRSVAQSLADDIAPKIAALPGCKGVSVFANESDGECGLFVLWATEADAAAPQIRPQLEQHIAGHEQSALDARLFEVFSK